VKLPVSIQRPLDRALGEDVRSVSLELAQIPVGIDVRSRSGVSVSGREGSVYMEALEGPLDVGGYDENPVWAGRGKYPILREMRTGDPAVRSLEWLFKMPIRRAKWTIEAASEDPMDVAIADFMAWQFGLPSPLPNRNYPIGRLSQTWDEQLAQVLLGLSYGAMGEELVWADEIETWTDADGDEHVVRPLARLAPRMASTIVRLETDPMTGLPSEVEQDLPGARPIPGSRFAWWVFEPEGTGRWGTSLLRPCWGPWMLKKGLMTASAIGWDRFAAGTLVVRYPRIGTPQDKRDAEAIGRNYKLHEHGWIVLQGAKPLADNEGDGWDVEILNGANSLSDPVPLLRWYDQQIAMAGVQQFSSLGTTETGSRAVGQTLQDPFYLTCEAIADAVAQARMRQVFRKIVSKNFGEGIAVPTLKVTGITPDDVEKLARILADLSSAGFSFSDPETQNDVRERIDIRHLPEEAVAAIRQLPERTGLEPIVPEEGGSIEGPTPSDRPAAAAA